MTVLYYSWTKDEIIRKIENILKWMRIVDYIKFPKAAIYYIEEEILHCLYENNGKP